MIGSTSPYLFTPYFISYYYYYCYYYCCHTKDPVNRESPKKTMVTQKDWLAATDKESEHLFVCGLLIWGIFIDWIHTIGVNQTTNYTPVWEQRHMNKLRVTLELITSNYSCVCTRFRKWFAKIIKFWTSSSIHSLFFAAFPIQDREGLLVPIHFPVPCTHLGTGPPWPPSQLKTPSLLSKLDETTCKQETSVPVWEEETVSRDTLLARRRKVGAACF